MQQESEIADNEDQVRMLCGGLLAIMAVGALVLGYLEELPASGTQTALTSVVLWGLVGTVVLVNWLSPKIYPWSTLVFTIAAPIACADLLSQPFLCTLAGLPLLLSGIVAGPIALLSLSLGSTYLVAAMVDGTDTTAMAVSLSSILCAAVLGWIMWYSNLSIVSASEERYHWAQSVLDQMRDRQAELKQALADQAELSRQLLLTTQKLEESRATVEEANRLKEDFVARVSHELRTPLNMIIGFSQMILEAPHVYARSLPQRLLADLAVILRNSEHLSELVDDVLDLSRSNAGRMAIARKRVNTERLIHEAEIVVQPLFEAKRLFLVHELDKATPEIWCDATRIREVLVNLLSNAGRHTDIGGVTIRTARDGPNVIISVTDTGTGIAQQVQDRVFLPFEQLEDVHRRKHGGTGLGLAISKRFVELHGGHMWLDSRSGQGCTFSFSLPMSPPTPIRGSAVRWMDPMWEYRQKQSRPNVPDADLKKRIVVVERGDAVRRLLQRHIEGIDAVRSATLKDAARSLQKTPAHLIIMNASSVSEGLQQIRRCRIPISHTPVITCSIPDTKITDGLGLVRHLQKPVSREDLLEAMRELPATCRRVLIVDDEPDALHLFWRMLDSCDKSYDVITAADGEEALTLIRESRPDVMLLDLVMPNMDGFRLLEIRNQDPELASIPVIVLSALDPSGQAIVSNSLAVSCSEGLSANQFLSCVEGFNHLFAPHPNGPQPDLGKRLE